MTALALTPLAGCLAWALLVRVRRAGAARRHRRMAQHPTPTFVFADLVGYTTLTERCGDEAAARVAGEFRRVMSLLSREHGACHVKSMGDGAMIWVPDASQALALAERTLLEVGTRPDLLPVRVGAHTGPAVMHDGDWYGSAVNVAARLAAAARPNEALVSDATQTTAAAFARPPLRRRGEMGLRGLARPVVVWRLAAQADGADAEPPVEGTEHPDAEANPPRTQAERPWATDARPSTLWNQGLQRRRHVEPVNGSAHGTR